MNPERVKRISHSFDERIANEPKVSQRDGHYVVFDGQHVIAARVDKNSGDELPILCKVYSDLTEQEEALDVLFSAIIIISISGNSSIEL